MLRLDMNLVFTIINVLILFVLLKKFLFKPVNDIIAKRQAMVEESLNAAAAAKEEAETQKREYEATMQDVDAARAKAIEEGRLGGQKEYERIVAQAQAKAHETVEEAKLRAEAEKKQILKSAQDEITQLVLDAAGKVSAAQESAEADLALYQQFIDKAGEAN